MEKNNYNSTHGEKPTKPVLECIRQPPATYLRPENKLVINITQKQTTLFLSTIVYDMQNESINNPGVIITTQHILAPDQKLHPFSHMDQQVDFLCYGSDNSIYCRD